MSVSFQPDGLRFLKLRVLSLRRCSVSDRHLDQVTVPSPIELTLQPQSGIAVISTSTADAVRCRVVRHRRVDGVDAPLHTHGVGPRRNLLRSWEGVDCVRRYHEAVDLERSQLDVYRPRICGSARIT